MVIMIDPSWAANVMVDPYRDSKCMTQSAARRVTGDSDRQRIEADAKCLRCANKELGS